MTTPEIDPRASELIQALALTRHPEGGWYREIFRSPHAVTPADGRPGRPALTLIYFLLTAGDKSRWHRLRSDEVWSHIEGAPLDMWLFGGSPPTLRWARLAPFSSSGAPTGVVPSGTWQAAQPAGSYSLVSCIVSPGFVFEDFELLVRGSEVEAALLSAWPEAGRMG